MTPTWSPLARSSWRWTAGGAYGGPSTSCSSWRRSGGLSGEDAVGNPSGHGCGCAALDLLNDDAHAHLEALGALLEELVPPCLPVTDAMRLVRQASCSGSPGPEAPLGVQTSSRARPASCMPDVHQDLLERGYMLAPSAYEVGFLSTPAKRTTSKVSWRRWMTC